MRQHTLTLDTNDKQSLEFVVSYSEEAFSWLQSHCTQDKGNYILECSDDDLQDLLSLMEDIKEEVDIGAQTDEDAFYALEDLFLMAIEEKE